MNLMQWAIRHGVSYAALADLHNELGLNGAGDAAGIKGTSEAAVQNAVRLEAADKGLRLWRNNVGALKDERGVPVRYGLANDSAQVNKVIKSGDLIGIDNRPVEAWEVGRPRGRFLSREIKKPGWTYCGDAHEAAQMNWAMLVLMMGGDAGFATGTGTL